MTETRVLHLITRFLDGGAEKTTLNTLEALADADREYDLRLGVGASHDTDRLASVCESGIETVVFDSIRHYNPVAACVAVVSVARYLSADDIDLVHTHSTEAGIIGRFAARLADVPIVVHEIHGDPITADRNALLNASIRRLEQVAAKTTTTLVVKSENIKQTYLDRGIGTPDQYRTIYHGVDLTAFREAEPERSDADPILLYAGRLSRGKGLFDLLNAADRLREEHSFKLLVAGSGPLADELSDRIGRNGLSDTVELLGYRDDIPALMASADVFVLPSYREGTPRVVTEALAAGTPVVATDIAGIPEQVEDGRTGRLVKPGATEELTSVLSRLVADAETRAEMGKHASESVDKFSLEQSQEAFRDLYEELLDDKS